MKNIFLKAYLKRNLGDDLFIKIICERYKDFFIINNDPKYDYTNISDNLKSNTSKIKKVFYKVIEKVKNTSNFQEKKIISMCDLWVTIGGSIFIENSNYKKQTANLLNIYDNKLDKLILGANFGPYKSEEFKKTIENGIFKKCLDVSFRDTSSYKLFSHLPNIRYNPDIILSLGTEKIQIKNNKKVIISVIDCTDRNINKDKYENKIIEFINYFFTNNYEIILMSFCQYEKDERAIKSILKKIRNKQIKGQVKKYFYRKNIDEAINLIASSSIIVGSRFHANILGLKFNKVVIPIAYSDKTINALNDLGYKSKIYDARNIDDIKIDSEFEQNLKYKCDVSEKIKQSENHFSILDTILERR